MPMFDFVENNFDSLLRHVEQYYDFKQILVKVCSRASYARDQIAIKIRASCEQDSIISRADREHTCARDRDLIASKCTYDSEPHCMLALDNVCLRLCLWVCRSFSMQVLLSFTI